MGCSDVVMAGKQKNLIAAAQDLSSTGFNSRSAAKRLAANVAAAAAPAVPELSIIIPTLNEERNIGALIRAVRRELKLLKINYELYVIDGGSTDRTCAEAAEASAKIVLQQERGFGAAVRQGMRISEGEWVLIMDADWSHPPAQIPELWAARLVSRPADGSGKSAADLVIGSRTVRGASSDAPLYRRFLTALLNLAYAVSFGTALRDVSSGFRLYRRSKLTPDNYQAAHFNIQTEVLFTSFRDSTKVVEVPLRYDRRANGSSNAGVWRDGVSFFRTLIKLRAKRQAPRPPIQT